MKTYVVKTPSGARDLTPPPSEEPQPVGARLRGLARMTAAQHTIRMWLAITAFAHAHQLDVAWIKIIAAIEPLDGVIDDQLHWRSVRLARLAAGFAAPPTRLDDPSPKILPGFREIKLIRPLADDEFASATRRKLMSP